MPLPVNEKINGPGAKPLSGREQQILELAASGLIDKSIAAKLGISFNTMRTYWARIRQKSGNLSRSGIIVAWVRGEFTSRETDFQPNFLTRKCQGSKLPGFRESDQVMAPVNFFDKRLSRCRACIVLYKNSQQPASIEPASMNEFCRILTDSKMADFALMRIRDGQGNIKLQHLITEDIGDKLFQYQEVDDLQSGILHALNSGLIAITCADLEQHQIPEKTSSIKEHVCFEIDSWPACFKQYGLKSAIGIPLIHHDKVIGSILLGSVDRGYYRAVERETLKTICSHLSAQIFAAGRDGMPKAM